MPLTEAALLEILACPACHSPLREEDAPQVPDTAAGGAAGQGGGELVCTSASCGLAYPVRDGIPVLLQDEARRPG